MTHLYLSVARKAKEHSRAFNFCSIELNSVFTEYLSYRMFAMVVSVITPFLSFIHMPRL